MPDDPVSAGRVARRSWILLVWAASGFSTVLITLVVTYVERVAFPDGSGGFAAGVIWAWTLAAAMLAAALLAPWTAAWADRRAAHQRAVIAATVVGAGGLAALAAIPAAGRGWVLVAVVIASVGFDLNQIFTGSLLPRLAIGPAADRLSSQGFAAGYAGGAIALLVATAIVAGFDRLGLGAASGMRVAFAFTALWWLGFSLPAAVARFGGGAGAAHAADSGHELLAFARRLWADAATTPLAAVLGGAMLALGAVQTGIAQFTSLAMQRLDLDGPALVGLVLLVQAVALPGALATGWISVRFGRRPAVAVCLGGWMAVLVLAWFVETSAQLHALAVLLALVLGGVQSLLRATVAGLAPEGRSGVTFGLLQVGTKLAGCVAGAAFGALEWSTHEPRAGLVALAVQIAAAWWLLRRMP